MVNADKSVKCTAEPPLGLRERSRSVRALRETARSGPGACAGCRVRGRAVREPHLNEVHNVRRESAEGRLERREVEGANRSVREAGERGRGGRGRADGHAHAAGGGLQGDGRGGK